MQGHKDNHAGLMTVAQMEKWRGAQNIRPGHEWDKFEGLSQTPAELEAFLAARAVQPAKAAAVSPRP